MNRRPLLFSLVVLLVFFNCQRFERVMLTVDLSQASSWRYLLGVDISGKLKAGGEERSYRSSLRTYLSGEHTGKTGSDSAMIRFTTGQTVITADFMDDAQRLNLARELENNTLYFAPQSGAWDASDTSFRPFVNVGGWNLFKSFARVVPVLPESPVRVGSTWDRERSFPLETDRGNATGWLYQSFTLDSIASLDSLARCAFVSWSFSYRIEPDGSGGATMLDSLPLKGAGTGTAVLDLNAHTLVEANALFDVPGAQALHPGAPAEASWQESVHLELIN